MKCEDVKERLDALGGDDMPVAEKERILAHLAACPGCSEEMAIFQALTSHLSSPSPVGVPDSLWPSIRKRLDCEPAGLRVSPILSNRFSGRRRIGIAAGIVLAIGAGAAVLNWPDLGVDRAEASVVNFDVLLNALPLNPEKAIRRFLVLYDAKPIEPSHAQAHAPDLNFGLPDKLPNGFVRGAVYGLRFGDSPGLAARYTRAGEIVIVIFHPPVHREDYGTHQDYPCIVGEHRGHTVSVGDWNLVHVTDATTCHCVLSRLKLGAELSGVLSAVAPDSKSAGDEHHHSEHSGPTS
jgi:hypothetical protein